MDHVMIMEFTAYENKKIASCGFLLLVWLGLFLVSATVRQTMLRNHITNQ
jgi:hypothetical protein